MPVEAPSVVALPHGGPALWRTPLDTVELARHVLSCRIAAPNTRAKGDRLEALMIWLFPHLPGVSAVRRNVFSADGSQEVDVVFAYDTNQGSGLDLGAFFLGECKNWKHPVDSSAVAWMDWKLKLGGVSDGILIAANGVTGKARRREDAWHIVSRCNSDTPRRRILVLTLDQIASIQSVGDLRQLIVDRMLDLTTGNSF